jgi:hypothetical protein
MAKEIENAETLRKREQLQIEINKNKVNIDRTVFVKSQEEKKILKQMKSEKNSSLREIFVEKIINSSPNWGNITVYV